MRMVKWLIGALLAAALSGLIPLPAKAESSIRVFDGKKTVSMAEDDYLVCVVAAEMPAAYQEEALKAQAIAARTRVAKGHCASHPKADVCVDSGCCQGFLDEAGQEARWGDDAKLYKSKIRQAVEETHGLILTYDEEPIEVLYHAVSGGWTEDVEDVYVEALPYLRAVSSPGEEEAKGFETMSSVTDSDLASMFPEEEEEGTVALEVLERSETGRVMWLRVGKHTMTGRTFRKALGLTSTNFDILREDGKVTFLQHGYGHGVGMSQAGAEAMAKVGARYDEILLHYYTGVTISLRMD